MTTQIIYLNRPVDSHPIAKRAAERRWALDEAQEEHMLLVTGVDSSVPRKTLPRMVPTLNAQLTAEFQDEWNRRGGK